MTVSAEDAKLLQSSLALLIADPRRTAGIFYDHLFALAPQTQGLFVRDMDRQGMKLMATLGTVAMRIEDWPALRPEIEQLGLRHLAYGVRPEHYAPTGEALQATLRDVMGEACTPEVARAWGAAYGLLEAVMASLGRAEPVDADRFV